MKKFKKLMFVFSAFALMVGLTATTNFVKAAPQNTGEMVIDSNENQPWVDEDWTLFANIQGGYSFKYPPAWNAAVNPNYENETIFGPTDAMNLGGVDVETYTGTLEEYINEAEQAEGAAKFLSKENVNINGVPGIRMLLELDGEFHKAIVVALKQGDQIFHIYMWGDEAKNVELFDKLIASFKFS